MRAWLVKEGTKVISVKISGLAQPKMKEQTIKKETMYFEEDVVIDPVGKFGVGPQHQATIGGKFAKQGYYGFKIPNNKEGWDTLLVHVNNIIVG